MEYKKVLGIDYGTKNVGVSLSDFTCTIAKGFTKVNNISTDYLIETISKIILENNVNKVVIGVTRRMNDELTKISESAVLLGEALEISCNINVVFFEEAMTTVESKEVLKSMPRKKRSKINIDVLASEIILQSYLNTTHE